MAPSNFQLGMLGTSASPRQTGTSRRFSIEKASFEKAAYYYEVAHTSYENAMNMAAPRARYYQELSYFMQARNRMEKAKAAHRSSKFSAASSLYQDASDLLSRSRRWGYSSQLYLAESLIEKGEDESNADQATRFSGILPRCLPMSFKVR